MTNKKHRARERRKKNPSSIHESKNQAKIDPTPSKSVSPVNEKNYWESYNHMSHSQPNIELIRKKQAERRGGGESVNESKSLWRKQRWKNRIEKQISTQQYFESEQL